MTDRQNAKYSMYTVVDTVLYEHKASIQTISALADAHGTLKAKIVALSDVFSKQKKVATGITSDKNFTRETLRTTTVTIAGLLYAYASSANNIILQALTKLTYSKLIRIKDDELARKAQTIHDEANTTIDSLTPFGITKDQLADFQSLINKYQEKTPAPRAAQSQQVALTQQLKTLFKETDTLP